VLDRLVEVGQRLVAIAAVVFGHAARLIGARKAGLQLEHFGEIADGLVEVAGAPEGGAAIEIADVHLLAGEAPAIHHPRAGVSSRAVFRCSAT